MDENTQNGCLGCGCLVILFVACFFIFIAASSGADASKIKPPPPLTPPSPSISPAVINKWELEVLDAENPGKQLQWSDYGKTEEALGTWLVVHISLHNTAQEYSTIEPI